MSRKGIEITEHSTNDHISTFRRGIEIRYKGQPVSMAIGTGYVYLVVDCSGSMAGDKLNQAKKGSLGFAKDALIKGYLIGLIQFDSSAVHLCEPQREISVLDQHLQKMEAGDTTHMAEAIRLAYEKLKDRGVVPRVMVIVTDGMPNGPYDPEASLKAGENAKKEGIDIITIGTDGAEQNFLRKLASRTELGRKVSREQLEQSIVSSVKMLPQLRPRGKGR